MDIEERASLIAGAYTHTDEVDLPYVVKEVYIAAATRQKQIDIDKLKSILNVLMIDTKDKAEIIKMMES